MFAYTTAHTQFFRPKFPGFSFLTPLYLTRYTYYMFNILITSITLAITPPTNTRTEELTLAKICVAEAGWNTDLEDCRAILRVLQNRPYKTITTAARLYNGRALGRVAPATPRDRWVAELERKVDRPKDFPEGDKGWSDYLDKWKLRLLDARILISEAHGASPCNHLGVPTEPIQWGGLFDKPDRGLVLLDCGPTMNRFYGKPQQLAN